MSAVSLHYKSVFVLKRGESKVRDTHESLSHREKAAAPAWADFTEGFQDMDLVHYFIH